MKPPPRLDVNYYELLELDVGLDVRVAADRASIENLIKRQQSHWERDSGDNPSWRRARARVILAAVPQLREDLARNPGVWQLHRDQFAKAKGASAARRAAAAVECLTVLGEPRIQERIVNELKNTLGTDPVRDGMSKLGVVLDVPDSAPPPTDSRFEKAIDLRHELGDVLTELRLDSLYELLSIESEQEFSAATPAAEINAALKDLSERFESKEKSSRLLIRKAKERLWDILQPGAAEKKKLFDELEPFNRVIHLERLIRALPGHITASQFERLVNAAQRAARVPAAEVENHFRKLCQLREVKVLATTPTPTATVLACAYCATLNDAKANGCAACSRSLWDTCVNCSERRLALIRSCPGCGLSDAAATYAAAALIRGQSFADTGDLESASACWKEVVEVAPIAAQSLQRSIDAARRRNAKTAAEIDQLLAAGKVHTARLRLDSDAIGRHEKTASQRARADAAIRDAAARTSAAREALAQGDTKVALAHLGAALSCATDDTAAQELLATIPPPAPKGLEFQLRQDAVGLQWRPGDSTAVTYRVVRTFDHPPIQPDDGVLVASGSATAAVDSTCPAGRSVCYGVFAMRGETASAQCAAVGPTLLLPTVSKLAMRQIGESLHFAWDKPAGARCVAITRSCGSDVTTRVAVAQSQWTDAAPGENLTTVYGFVAQYDVPGLGIIDADAISIEAAATPEPSLARIGPPTGDRRSVSWSPVAEAGAVDIVLAYRRRPAIEAEKVIALDALPTPAHSFPAGGATRLEPAIFGEYWFVVARQRGELVRCCAPSKRTFARPIDDATILQASAGIMLQWTWPVGCDAAAISVQLDDGAPSTRVVTRSGSMISGTLGLPVPQNPAELRITIAATEPKTGVTSEPNALRHRITAPNRLYFTVKRARGLFKVGRGGHPRVQLKVHLEHVEPMPAFQVRFDSSPLPGEAEGECLLVVPAGATASAESIVELGSELAGRTGFLNVHLTAPSDQARIEVMPLEHEIH